MYLLKEARPNRTQMRVFFVIIFFQILQERPLELVDLFDVAEDGLELDVREHAQVFPALADITLNEHTHTHTSYETNPVSEEKRYAILSSSTGSCEHAHFRSWPSGGSSEQKPHSAPCEKCTLRKNRAVIHAHLSHKD